MIWRRLIVQVSSIRCCSVRTEPITDKYDMSEEQPLQQPQQTQQQPLFGVEKIYLKDMSLELPNAPQVFFEREAPQVEVNIHNEASGMAQEGYFEVVLTVTVTAKIQAKTVFLVEAAQAGIF